MSATLSLVPARENHLPGSVVRWVSALFLCLCPGGARSNGPEVGRDAGVIFPLQSTTVQLRSEHVVVALPKIGDRGLAVCTYELRNLSAEDQHFEMAFLRNQPFGPRSASYHDHYLGLALMVRQRGVELPVTYAAIAKDRWSDLSPALPDSLPVWQVSIPASGTVLLEMTYEVEWSGGADGRHATRTFHYHAHPAALWAGAIETAEITLYLDRQTVTLIEEHLRDDDCFRLATTPQATSMKAPIVYWSFSDWEPEGDLGIEIDYCWE